MNTIPHPGGLSQACSVSIGDLVWFRARAAGATGRAGEIWQSGRVQAVVRSGRAVEVVSELIGGMRHDWGAIPISKVQTNAPGTMKQYGRKTAPLAKVVERIPSTTRTKGERVPKVLPLRSSEYLAYVRLQRCARCLRSNVPRQAHHMPGPRGVGTKTDDLRAVALCAECHEGVHRANDLPAARERIMREQLDTLIGWLRTKLDSGTR